jgi:hypothetical protein
MLHRSRIATTDFGALTRQASNGRFEAILPLQRLGEAIDFPVTHDGRLRRLKGKTALRVKAQKTYLRVNQFNGVDQFA